MTPTNAVNIAWEVAIKVGIGVRAPRGAPPPAGHTHTLRGDLLTDRCKDTRKKVTEWSHGVV